MFLRAPSLACISVFLVLAGCSPGAPERKSITFAAGDKASVDKLTYNIIDTQILPRLGDETNPRIPQNRFYVVQVSVSNGGNSDLAVPGMSLIDDSGKPYEELLDGAGLPHWLGVTRKVQANQTEQGTVLFDAPAGHYKLRLTDDTDENDVYVDIPLSFAHEQMQNETQSTSETVAPPTPAVAAPAGKK